MTRLVYLMVARLLKEHSNLRKSRLLAVHVGPGNTRLMLFNKGRIVQYTSYRMGVHRVAEATERLPTDSDTVPELIKGHINGIIEQIEEAYVDETIDAILAIGHEIQPVAKQVAKHETLMEVERKSLRRLKKRLSSLGDK